LHGQIVFGWPSHLHKDERIPDGILVSSRCDEDVLNDRALLLNLFSAMLLRRVKILSISLVICVAGIGGPPETGAVVIGGQRASDGADR
jgi:hypothetical protein